MRLTHTDETGQARMVNVGRKASTRRFAMARGVIRMRPETLEAIRTNTLQKGDALGVARVAGILAAKRTSDMVPLCHPLQLTDVQVRCELDADLPGVAVEASAETTAPTGVEMEAIMAVSVTLITLFDMAKSMDKTMCIGEICVVEKRGGKSGDWRRA